MEPKICSLCGGEPKVKQVSRDYGHKVGTYIEVVCPGKCAFVEVCIKGRTDKDIQDAERKAVELWNKNAF